MSISCNLWSPIHNIPFPQAHSNSFSPFFIVFFIQSWPQNSPFSFMPMRIIHLFTVVPNSQRLWTIFVACTIEKWSSRLFGRCVKHCTNFSYFLSSSHRHPHQTISKLNNQSPVFFICEIIGLQMVICCVAFLADKTIFFLYEYVASYEFCFLDLQLYHCERELWNLVFSLYSTVGARF